MIAAADAQREDRVTTAAEDRARENAERDARHAALRRRGDQASMDALILENLGLVKRWHARYARRRGGLTQDTIEEALAEMTLAFVEACWTWDPDKVALVPYVYWACRRAYFATIYRDRAVPLPVEYSRGSGRNGRIAREMPYSQTGFTATNRKTGEEYDLPLPDPETPYLRLHGLEALALRLLAGALTVDTMHAGMAAAGLNMTQLAFRAGVTRGTLYAIRAGAADFALATRIRVLSVLWPYVREDLERASGASWAGGENPFLDLAAQIPKRTHRTTAPRASDAALLEAGRLTAEKLRAARERAGLKLYVAARLFGVSKQTWSAWETGQKPPGRATAPRLVEWIRKHLGPEV